MHIINQIYAKDNSEVDDIFKHYEKWLIIVNWTIDYHNHVFILAKNGTFNTYEIRLKEYSK